MAERVRIGGESSTAAKPGRRRLPLDVDLARRLLADGRSTAAVARLLGVSPRTLSRYLAQPATGAGRECGILPIPPGDVGAVSEDMSALSDSGSTKGG